jgi:hypothetical protein
MKSALAAAPVLLAAIACARADPVVIAANGLWTAVEDISTSRKACGVQALINGGTFLLSGANDRPGVLRLSLHKPTWQIPNLGVPVVLTFSDGFVFNLVGTGKQDTIRVDLRDLAIKALIHEFTAKDWVTAALPGGREAPWQLDLVGTTPTIRAMARCLDAAQILLPPPFAQPHASEPAAQPSINATPATAGAASGRSNWRLISRTKYRTDYLDSANISRTGNLATIWHVQDFNNTAGPGGKPIPLGAPGHEFLSVKYEIEFDCDASNRKVLYYATFSGHMGTGSIQDGGPSDEPSEPVAPGEITDLNYACNGNH